MSHPKRYFLNKLPDYPGGHVSVDKSQMKGRVMELVQTIAHKWKKTPQNCDGGLYVGLPGAAFTFLRFAKMPEFADERSQLLQQATEYLKPALACAEQTRSRGSKVDVAAFILGNGGVYAVAAVLSKELGNFAECKGYLNQYGQLAPILTPVNWLSCGGDEYLVGRAGYLAGLLWLREETGLEVLDDGSVNAILDAMLESGQKYAATHRSPVPLMYQYYKTEYLGAAHGLAGILQMLLSFPKWLSVRPQAQELIKRSVDVLMSLQTPTGNFPCAMDELGGQRREEDELVHWCHGAPGTMYLLGKAYKVFQEQKYLNACVKCGDVTWQKGLLKKGPGICHGVAGSGYVFLTLYRLTGDHHHLHRALQFSHFLQSSDFQRARTPDSPYSLFEGLAGTACFLADLMNPLQASFPLFSIF